MQFISHKPDRHRSPEALEVGWFGMRVYELLLDVSAHFDLMGRLPERYCNPEFLCSFWGFLDESRLNEVVVAIARLERAGLLEFADEDGTLTLTQWDKMYSPKTHQGRRGLRNLKAQLQDYGNESVKVPPYSTEQD